MISEQAPGRIVSLVPSMTESLFDLGLGNYVVGITDYCIYPKKDVENLPKLGGTKNPRIEEIIRLHPDLVIANKEENSEQSILHIRNEGIPVWLTFPKTVEEAIDDLWNLARTFQSDIAYQKIRLIEKIVEFARLTTVDQPVPRYFCPIWYEKDRSGKSWWMTFNQDTFSHDLLSLMGLQNVFANRKRLYPIEADLGMASPEPTADRDDRYPRVRLDEIVAAKPDLIIFPNEPYSFGEEDARQLLSEIQAIAKIEIHYSLIDGSLITWPGTRIAKAISQLAPEFTKLTKGVDDDTLELSE